MRDIKFRAWDVRRKVLANVTSIMWLSEDEIEIDHDKNGLREPFQIHAETAILEQFTGKKVWLKINDLKEKVDLFDGDIVSFRIPDCIGNLTSHVGQIYWCDCAFWVDCTDIEGDEGIYGLGEVLIQDENVEIIGNIHDKE